MLLSENRVLLIGMASLVSIFLISLSFFLLTSFLSSSSSLSIVSPPPSSSSSKTFTAGLCAGGKGGIGATFDGGAGGCATKIGSGFKVGEPWGRALCGLIYCHPCR